MELLEHPPLFSLRPLRIHTTHPLLRPSNFTGFQMSYNSVHTLLVPHISQSECTSCIFNVCREQHLRFLGRGLCRVPQTMYACVEHSPNVEHPPKHILPTFFACASNIVIALQLFKMVNPIQFWNRCKFLRLLKTTPKPLPLSLCAQAVW
jgi:hypothetical protein